MPFTLNVIRIELQRDDFRPLPPDPLTFETLHLKRAVATIVVRKETTESILTAVLEFRGDALTISAEKEAEYNSETVARWLEAYYKKRYAKDGLKVMGRIEGGRVCDCTVSNPDIFSDFSI